MSEATLPLQAAVIAALKAHAPLAAIVGTKVFDRVPAGTAAPYLCLSGWQEIEDGTDCMDASEVFFDVQCFSTSVGRPEAARIAAAVKAALHRLAPATAGWSETEILYRSTQYFTETDGTTTRAVVNFQSLTDSDA
ncbi:DUF3168 domain-containing protein [Bosea sp. FBZP-16]|uniref:DUF3168 domain-containing protein n=1 Tax=Bosea sp. FBZP-16 TaxID=2065382 RepID=UPI000C3107DC|nr:DUF3168 domain-containing protein [Bosea sp. FBZP-16]